MKTIFSALALLCAAAASAASIRIDHPYSHPTAAPGVPAVGFITLTNGGKKADRLIAAESPAAERIEIHETQMQGGVMRMRALGNGVALPAGKTVRLAPGGIHLMLFGPRQPLLAGQSLPVTLKFEHAAAMEVLLIVEPREPESPPAEDHSQHDH
ncbi:MAG: copper chaperone PCu(A)C [Pseudomonadota bacterium]